MRRYYLLIVIITEDYLRKNFPKYYEKLIRKYKPKHIKFGITNCGVEDCINNKCKLVENNWISEDIAGWLKKNGYKHLLKIDH